MNRLSRKKNFIIVSIISIGIFSTGCMAKSTGNETGSDTGIGGNQVIAVSKNTTSSPSTATTKGSNLVDLKTLFTAEDKEQTVSQSNATRHYIKGNQTINIDKEGTYIISGTAEESKIIVNAPANSTVKILLDGVNITNRNFPAIYVKSAGKVLVNSLQNSSNTLKVTGDFTTDGSQKIDSVIFSNSDLTLNGNGKTTITSTTGNGVTSKDNLKITGGVYTIISEKHSLEGDNSVRISGGNFTMDTAKDGVHSENSDDNTSGFVYISGGTFDIKAKDDGIQATTFAIIDGGTFKIDGAEGIEATHVQINNGDIDIKASDDGVNAAEKTTARNIHLEINGGNIKVVMAEGDTDAFDSNGDLTINGGNFDITAGSAFDFDGLGKLNGGTIYVNGKKLTELTNQMFPGRGGRRRF